MVLLVFLLVGLSMLLTTFFMWHREKNIQFSREDLDKITREVVKAVGSST
jgi:hypothetical protein